MNELMGYFGEFINFLFMLEIYEGIKIFDVLIFILIIFIVALAIKTLIANH